MPKPIENFLAALLEKGGAAMMFFDQWSGPKLVPVSATGTWPGSMIRLDVRRDRLMPAFGRSRAASFRGDVKYTRLNLGYRWKGDDIVDKPDRAELTIWRSGRRAGRTTDITLRRAQNFKVRPGQACQWKLGDKSGAAKVGEDGLLTIYGIPMPSRPTRLVVTAE
jgi:hypothetical protein